jgi:hypothetical protein
MLYLAPGRRLVCLAVLGISAALGAVVFLSCFAFNMRDLNAAAVLRSSGILGFTAERVRAFLFVPGGLLELFPFLACVLVFVLWNRPRYFGNAAPLVVACLLPWWPGEFISGASILWSLPFVFVFIGGVYADLLEPRFFAGRFQKLVATTAFVLVGAILIMALAVIARA